MSLILSPAHYYTYSTLSTFHKHCAYVTWSDCNSLTYNNKSYERLIKNESYEYSHVSCTDEPLPPHTHTNTQKKTQRLFIYFVHSLISVTKKECSGIKLSYKSTCTNIFML